MCDVLSNKTEDGYDQLVAHIILDDGVNNQNNMVILSKIQEKIYELTNNINMVPKIFKIWKEFPYAKSGKRDIQKMKRETSDFVYVDFELSKKLVRK